MGYLPGAAVRYPDSIEPHFQPMLFTRIRIYGNHALKDYDSGLTCPKGLALEPKPGDILRFRYEFGSHPRLCCEAGEFINCETGTRPATQ